MASYEPGDKLRNLLVKTWIGKTQKDKKSWRRFINRASERLSPAETRKLEEDARCIINELNNLERDLKRL